MLSAFFLFLHATLLTGEVGEAGRLEPIRFATVQVLEDPDRTSSTDRDGFFSLELEPGSWTVRVTAQGYRTVERTVRLTRHEDVHLQLEMEPLPVQVEGLRAVVEAPKAGFPFETFWVDSALVALQPTLVERDVLRGLQVLPSVTPASDFSGAPYVRGGTPSQTRLFLDGAPIFNPYHLGGFVSAFDPSSVAAAALTPGGVSAAEPSSLSGTLHVVTRDGGRDSTRVRGGVGLLSSRLAVDGPVNDGKGGYLFSVRRTYLDVATNLAASLGLIDYELPYNFLDSHGKLTHDLGQGGRVSVSGYLSREGLREFGQDLGSQELRWNWSTQMLSVRARKLLPGLGRAEIGAAVSRFAGTYGQGAEDPFGLDAAFRYETFDVRIDRASGRHVLSGGARVERTPYRYDLDPGRFVSILPSLDLDESSRSYSFFLEDRWQPTGSLAIRIGFRTEQHEGFEWRLLPRGGMSYEPAEGLHLSLSGGRYVQGFTSLRNEEAGLASIVAYDLLVPPDSVLPAGWDVTAGAALANDEWSVRIDAFHKQLKDLSVAPQEADPANAPLYIPSESFTTGDARVRGLEVAARGTVARWDFNLSYRLQDEQRTVGGIRWTPRNHRLHRLMLSGRRPWGDGSVNASLSWMSGQPFTPVRSLVPGTDGFDESGRPEGGGWTTPLLGSHNSARLPGYLRLDVGVRRTWSWSLAGQEVELEPYLSVMNVLNQKNVLWGEYEAGGQVELGYGPQLPVLPSFGLRFRF